MHAVVLKKEKPKCPDCGADMDTTIVVPNSIGKEEKEEHTEACVIDCRRPMNKTEFVRAAKAIKKLVNNEKPPEQQKKPTEYTNPVTLPASD